MAGLTKEQRAERDAAKAAAPSDTTELVTMQKDGESLDVHPSCVKAHQAAGWKLAE